VTAPWTVFLTNQTVLFAVLYGVPVPTAVLFWVFRVVTLCRLENSQLYFGEACSLHVQDLCSPRRMKIEAEIPSESSLVGHHIAESLHV
jgi:hypothetical protein